ncbi:hypothetical protein CYMTET_33581 [Cymbomonas tetramitiformis]|uniref:Uncharacterized protein n=1 Tax=Cymbomonas tetramitiformis TaxID=36881 RepID=A0AAE0KR25_9CHLO|nr:hypothetical protein CYMTET_33581 [Cymbomonas tetramitiformis]
MGGFSVGGATSFTTFKIDDNEQPAAPLHPAPESVVPTLNPKYGRAMHPVSPLDAHLEPPLTFADMRINATASTTRRTAPPNPSLLKQRSQTSHFLRSSPIQSNIRGTVTTACSIFTPEAMFTIGTVGVMPFYAMMIGAPNSKLTRRVMQSPLPCCVLAVMYVYLLYVSWAPDTLQKMFSNQYFFPELAGIAEMFARYKTVASAWLHLLAVDLFAASYEEFDFDPESQ